jgi:hypothetical protein
MTPQAAEEGSALLATAVPWRPADSIVAKSDTTVDFPRDLPRGPS